MPYRIGNDEADRIYLGSDEVDKIYLGTDEVYTKTVAMPVFYSRTGTWNWFGTSGQLYDSPTTRVDIPDDNATYGLWVDDVQQYRANHVQSGLSASDLPNSNIQANPGYTAADRTFTGREFGDLNRAWFGQAADRNRNWAIGFTDVAASTTVRWSVVGVSASQSAGSPGGSTSGRGLPDFVQVAVFGAFRSTTTVEVRRVTAATS